MPTFSIITPTFNRAYIIEKAIKSVLRQRFNDWELIIIDDGSTDNTNEVIQPYLNEKIKYFNLNKNSGPNVARNIGCNKAIGEWLIFLDSDDELTDNALEIINAYIQKFTDVDFFIFACKDLDGNIPINIKDYEGYITFKDFLCRIKGEALPVIRKNVFEKTKFNENIVGGEHITWIDILKDNHKAYFSNKVVRIYNTKLQDRLSFKPKNYKRLVQVYIVFIKKFYKDLILICPFTLIMVILKIIVYNILNKIVVLKNLFK
jgi:glycosyltransferase involved in cell wall biosynthesis